MEQWVSDKLQTWFDGEVIVFSDDETNIMVQPSVFSGADFASITTPTHAALSALPIASQGWQRIFDHWKAKGLLQ